MARDLELVLLAVAGQLEHLHPVEQGRRDGIEDVGRGDEHHLGEIEGEIEIVIGELVVLFRV